MANQSDEREIHALNSASFWASEAISCLFSLKQPRDVIQGTTRVNPFLRKDLLIVSLLISSFLILNLVLGRRKCISQCYLRGWNYCYFPDFIQ